MRGQNKPPHCKQKIMEKVYNMWPAEKIKSQATANILIDWVLTNGKHGITIPQGILGVKQDGIIGEETIKAINNYPNQKELFNKIKQMRKAYINMICLDNPDNRKFKKEWLKQLDFNKFKPGPI